MNTKPKKHTISANQNLIQNPSLSNALFLEQYWKMNISSRQKLIRLLMAAASMTKQSTADAEDTFDIIDNSLSGKQTDERMDWRTNKFKLGRS